jgi:DNA-binding MarR family transcriptional regulator
MSVLQHPRKHDDLLNYRLKRLFKLGGAPAVRLCEGRYGIARNEWRILAAICEDGPQSPSVLHERVGGDRARTSRMVGTLVDKGLVAREPDATDGRRAVLHATETGSALYKELFPQLARINERLMAVLTASESMLLEEFLERLTGQAERIRLEGDGVAERADRRRGGSRTVWERRTRDA